MKNRHWLSIVCNLDLFVATIALIVLVLVTSTGAFCRYALNSPILWQEEVQAFCQVWLVFLGASVAFRAGSHVAIEMVVDSLPPGARRVFAVLIDVIVLFVLTYFAVNAQAFIMQVFGRSGRPSAILRIPLIYQYGIAPYGTILMILSYFAARFAPDFVRALDTNMAQKEGGK